MQGIETEKLYANVINQLMPCTKPPRLDDEVAVLYCDDQPILVHKYRDSKKEDISLAYEAAGWLSEYSEQKEKSNDGLVTCYANLIIKGTKTLDDVPMAIREKVEKQLEEVEFNNTFYKSLCETATFGCLATYKTEQKEKSEAKTESIGERENPIMRALRKFVEFLNEFVDLFIADWD